MHMHAYTRMQACIHTRTHTHTHTHTQTHCPSNIKQSDNEMDKITYSSSIPFLHPPFLQPSTLAVSQKNKQIMKQESKLGARPRFSCDTSNLFHVSLTFHWLLRDVRPNGHDQVDDEEPEGHQGHEVVELIGAVHDEAQHHHQKVQSEQHLHHEGKAHWLILPLLPHSYSVNELGQHQFKSPLTPKQQQKHPTH